MVSRRSYMIVAPVAGGRHRLGTPGTAPRYRTRPPRQNRRRRAWRRPRPRLRPRHRRTEPRSRFTARYASLLVLLGMIGISGWFAAAGAAAVAQMIQP
jgi:hypothetical protein